MLLISCCYSKRAELFSLINGNRANVCLQKRHKCTYSTKGSRIYFDDKMFVRSPRETRCGKRWLPSSYAFGTQCLTLKWEMRVSKQRHTDRHLREKHKSAVSPGLIPPPSVPSCSPHPFPVPANDCSAHYTQTNTHTHSHTALMLESLDSIFTSVWNSITADNQIAYKLIRH